MFKGVSQCIPAVRILYFGPFNPFHCFLSITPIPHFPQFSVHILISSTFTSYGMQNYWCSIVLFSSPSFPEFHCYKRSTYEFPYDHACFCVYVYLWIYVLCMRENMQLLSFWTWLSLLKMMSSNCIHLLSNHIVSFFLMAEKIPLYINTTFS
jgi:hypothetical protein